MPVTNVQILHSPEAGICIDRLNRGPHHYARQLARYMRDPSKVRANTVNEWGRAPTLAECADMIAAAHAERQRYRDETERLGESDKDAVDFQPAPTPDALDMQRLAEVRAANVITLPDVDPTLPAHSRKRHFLDETVEAIAVAMKVTVADIVGPSKLKTIVQVRQVVCWTLHKRGQSYSQIGRRINRDHTSVMHAVARFETHATDRMRLVAEHFAEIFDEEVVEEVAA